jgi:hypothetical protein
MTSIKNLPNIISQDGLLCKNELINQKIEYTDIANKDVQDRRSETLVPFSPGGNLHSYVPFYFWGQSPMLLVNRADQKDMIFFVSKPKIIHDSGVAYAFTDRHPIITYAEFSDDLDKLGEYLDMTSIKSRYWNNDAEHPDRKERKQAEFLVYQKVPLNLICGIVTIDEDVTSSVQSILSESDISIPVKPFGRWYYL